MEKYLHADVRHTQTDWGTKPGHFKLCEKLYEKLTRGKNCTLLAAAGASTHCLKHQSQPQPHMHVHGAQCLPLWPILSNSEDIDIQTPSLSFLDLVTYLSSV